MSVTFDRGMKLKLKKVGAHVWTENIASLHQDKSIGAPPWNSEPHTRLILGTDSDIHFDKQHSFRSAKSKYPPQELFSTG
jgi:hypothetical protein